MLGLRTKHWSRREFLSVGSLGLGGLALPDLLQAEEAVKKAGGLARDKCVVFLFQHGGPSQYETFDPKMSAPSGIRSMTGEIPTTIPGITFGSTMQRLARLAHKFSLVRSFTTESNAHDSKPIISKRYSAGAHIGSHYARVTGANNPRNGMPRNLSLFPRAVDSSAKPAFMDLGRFDSTGPLGSAYAPFAPSGDGNLKRDMQLAIDPARLDDRRSLLAQLDQWRRVIGESDIAESFDRFQSQAYQTLTGSVSEAFDITREDPNVIERYDTSRLMDVSRISKKWNNHPRYAEHVNSLGKLLLLARRLAERGAGFITITTNFVWDMHADANNATMIEGMGYVGTPFDHAVSAFIEDVEARGLRDKILLVCCGEMGRTPKVNAKGGREHWAGVAPLMLYGGGLKMGRVVGSTTRDGGEPASDRITIPNLYATIMDTLLDTGTLRTMAGIPPEVQRVIHGADPISQLL
jgi:hypothetical protein